MKEQRSNTKVASVQELLEDDLSEFIETDLVWSLPTRSCLKSLPIPIAPISNSFEELEEDDEDEVLAALKQLTHNVKIGPKIPQSQLRRNQAMSKKQVNQIAQQVRSGDIALPDLDLASNAEYEAVWALVDSGAGKSCANKARHFPHVQSSNQPSQVRMATANGQELKSRGTFTVHGQTSEGQTVVPKFEDTDVEMPIIAVNDLSLDDAEVIFRQDSGELIDGATGRRSQFIKKRGVCFMKMYYKKDQCSDDCDCPSDSGFTRPGAP